MDLLWLSFHDIYKYPIDMPGNNTTRYTSIVYQLKHNNKKPHNLLFITLQFSKYFEGLTCAGYCDNYRK